MSYVRIPYVVVSCDGNDCHVELPPDESATIARRKAIQWKYIKGKDYCPDCIKLMKLDKKEEL